MIIIAGFISRLIAEIIGYPLEKYGVSISSVKDQFVLQLEAHGLNDEKESVYDRRGILFI